jgi:hypothetical protein
MSTLREAIVLPLLFLTVAFAGGVRLAADTRLVAPPLASLLLGMLLLGALVRAGVFAPDALVHTNRTPLQNASGTVVILTLFAASAQVFNLLTPERGLLHAMFSVFFAIQLSTTMAAVRDRAAMLRSLLVLFGAVFALRFVILENLYAPGGGLLARLITAAAEGVTLGALDYEPNAPATGYIGLATLTLYVIGLVLLEPTRSTRLHPSTLSRHMPETIDAIPGLAPRSARRDDACEDR